MLGMLILLSNVAIKQSIPLKVADRVVSFNTKKGARYGTGFNIRYRQKRFTITNAHVCRVAAEHLKLKNNQIIVNNKIVKILKIWKKHDLCAVESTSNKYLRLANDRGYPLDKVIVAGHSEGNPLLISEGRIVGDETIWLSFTKIFKATAISAAIYPGNSGSPVTDEYGSVLGVVFAGRRGSSTGFMVPYKHLKEFLDIMVNEARQNNSKTTKHKTGV